MQLKPITAIIVLSLVVAALLVAGCTVNSPGASSPTPSPTSTPTPTDHSSFYAGRYESVDSIVVQPFTKASVSNMRGNDVYRGVIRNASEPGSKSFTIVIEETKSQNEATQLYDKTLAEQANAGYVFNYASTANFKAFEKSQNVDIQEAWVGSDSAGHVILCVVENNQYLGTSLFITQASE